MGVERGTMSLGRPDAPALPEASRHGGLWLLAPPRCPQLAGVGAMQTATWALHLRKGQEMCAAPQSTARAGLTR